ncbi:hypothetical protein HOE425_333066 [Hoeflea sp. EC-HK425]|nr:hypothetical protein HOE425_333066 [Hoeflea sp. EC-HK425]
MPAILQRDSPLFKPYRPADGFSHCKLPTQAIGGMRFTRGSVRFPREQGETDEDTALGQDRQWRAHIHRTRLRHGAARQSLSRHFR